MNKTIVINDNHYDLKTLSNLSDYFMAMYNFEQSEYINLTHRGISYEIIIKILLDNYDYDENYIIYYDEIMELKDELMLNDNIKIKSIEEMCNCIVYAFGEIKLINNAIWRFHNNKLTKKQKKSMQYSEQFWKKIRYLSFSLSYDENKNIYKENGSLLHDRYEGNLCFDIIKNAYVYSKILKKSKYLVFEDLIIQRRTGNAQSFWNSDELLLMKNNFELYLTNICLYQEAPIYSYDKNLECKMRTFFNYKNSEKIEKLYLTNCYFKISDDKNLQYLIDKYVISDLPNLKYLEINNLKIIIENYKYHHDTIVENSLIFTDIIGKIDENHTIKFINITDYD